MGQTYSVHGEINVGFTTRGDVRLEASVKEFDSFDKQVKDISDLVDLMADRGIGGHRMGQTAPTVDIFVSPCAGPFAGPLSIALGSKSMEVSMLGDVIVWRFHKEGRGFEEIEQTMISGIVSQMACIGRERGANWTAEFTRYDKSEREM
jgi:hypothetical protein